MRRRGKAARRGAVLPLVALCLVAVVGMLALAIDIGMVALARSQCQNAADAAAMAGARTINGDVSSNYNYAAVPGNAVKAAVANKVLSQAVAGDPASIAPVNSYTYQSGQVTLQIGAYAYIYNDGAPATEAFEVQIPRADTSEPYSAVRATVSYAGALAFGRVFGASTQSSTATAVAVHRPRDVVIIMDLSGSMRFQSLPGTPMSGSQAAPSASDRPRTRSLNPDPIFPKFGHYSDIAGAGLQGATSIATTGNEYVDPSNISSTADSGPPVVADFYQNPPGVPAGPGNVAFSSAPAIYAATPGGDNYLRTALDTGATYAQTVAQFNNNSASTNPLFEMKGYTGYRLSFNGYTQGPGYWGKTFWIWPPAPPGPNVLTPPASLTDTTFNWHHNGSNDWRQRFFVAVNTANNVPSWISHNTMLFDTTGSGAPIKRPGNLTTVTENGVQVTYDFRVNYAAILYWLTRNPNPFPPTLQAGRIRYYSKIPDGADKTLNNRWWTTTPSSLPNDERFWKEYIDFVLGYTGKGANSYNRFQSGIPVSSLIGNGDYYTWTGSTVQVTQRPQPQPAPGSPNAPYQSGTLNKDGGNVEGDTVVPVSGLSSAPVAYRDYAIIDGDSANPYLIVNSNVNSLQIATGLVKNIPQGSLVQVYSPYMSYTDNPPRPRHQLWFGPLTFVDWLGNYNLNTLNNLTAPHLWWPGNCHEAHAWACKIGISTAIDDIRRNHPSDFVALTFFSSPMTSNSSSGYHNRAAVPLGRNYQMLKDSLWFPPSTVTGGKTEISPYDPDMSQVPRANGGTGPGMGLMLAYNLFGSSSSNLRFYAQPQPQYRGDAGGLGRKGASRLIILETDGAPNTRAFASLVNQGADSFYPVRVKYPLNLSDSKNTEWPGGGSYANSEVYDVVKQICALETAAPPGFSSVRKPALIHCIGYGSLFDPAYSGTAQTNALTFLQTVQYHGNTAADTNPSSFPAFKRIYGTNDQRIANIRQAITTIMQSGVQVSLIE